MMSHPLQTLPTDTMLLNWSKQDPEQRLGFTGGRFTRINLWLGFLLAIAGTLAIYGVCIYFTGHWLADMLTQRGWTQHAVVFISCWAIAILWFKWRKLRFQRRALDLVVMPAEHDFILIPETADQVIERIYQVVDDPAHFLLFNRIVTALSALRNLGRVGDIDEIIRSQAGQDESSLETTYSILRGFIWAIPVLGFIGTVVGLSDAIGGFSAVLGKSEEISEITSSLKGVTSGLSTAFETTLVALIAALVIQLLLTFLKKSEEEFLDRSSEYCLKNVVSRVRILPTTT
jgi:biopolymer transport protein ExbB/TolQ